MKIRRIFNNLEIKLICLLLAIVVWLYATRGTETVSRFMGAIPGGEQEWITFREVSVDPVGAQGKWRSDPDKISLEVRCPSAEVQVGDFRAIVKLAEKDEKAGRVVTLTAKNVTLPKGLVFVKANPGKIQLVSIR